MLLFFYNDTENRGDDEMTVMMTMMIIMIRMMILILIVITVAVIVLVVNDNNDYIQTWNVMFVKWRLVLNNNDTHMTLITSSQQLLNSSTVYNISPFSGFSFPLTSLSLHVFRHLIPFRLFSKSKRTSHPPREYDPQ